MQELTNVKVSDIEFTKNSITIRAKNTKNNEQRNSRISPKLSLQLKEFVGKRKLSQNDFLFSTRQSPQMSDKRVFQLIRGYAAKVGITGVSPQIIRNSHIAHGLAEGKLPAEIEAQTGVKHLGIHHFGLAKAKMQMNEKND